MTQEELDEFDQLVFDDLKYAVLAKVVDEYRCDFSIYSIVGIAESGFRVKGCVLFDTASGHPTDDIREAQRFMHGYVKWDGDSVWDFDVAMQFSNDKEMLDFGQMLAKCWNYAECCIPRFHR